MPVGGGHHGGGHHGGGHHGGGHHGGGHHHGIGHHHHHHYGGGGYYGYNSYHRRGYGVFYYSPFRWFYRGLVLFVVVIIVGIVFMSISLSKVFSGPSLHSVIASPQDDRALSFSQSSCGDIDISTFQYDYPVMLYLMETKPGIVAGSNFTVSNTWYLGYGDYQYYNYYLLTQSTIEISLYTSSRGVDVYILSGSQFANFKDDEYFNSKYHATCTSISSSSPCVYSYTVYTDDEYYIVFDETSLSTSVYTSLSIQKTRFIIQDDEIYDSCNASCALTVPATPVLYPIVITGDVTTGSWTDSVQYTWYCTSVFSVPTWVYILLVVGVGTAAASIVGIIVVVVFLYYKKKSKRTSEPLITTAPQDPHPANPTAPPTSYQPAPPVVPSYPSYPTEQPPSYGWVNKN